MRKYYQAALVVTAVVSLVSLLIYRHEYNKLRYVLEVFNYFGKPNLKTAETNCTINVPIFTKPNMKFEEPFSSWQRLDNDLYVYSAYNIRDKEVQVIGFGSSTSIKDVQCAVLFESMDEPVLGSFSYLSIDNKVNLTNADKNVNYKGYHFYCTYTKNKVPVGIIFLTKSNTNFNEVPILPIKTQPQSLNYTNTGICISPPLTKPIQRLQMVSFINFHDIIGIDNFIVYDFGIPNEFNSNFRELSKSQSPYWKFTYTVVPWNFPFPGIHPTIINNLIQADCLYRTYNKITYITTLSWDEYIVLKYHHSLADLMKDYKRARMKAERYKLKTSTFCTQQIDSTVVKNITFTIFKKLRYDSTISDNQPIYIYNTHEALTKNNIYTRDIGNDLVTLNRYKHCYGKFNTESDTKDTSILKFTEDIQNSYIYKKFVINNKF
ncbi:uncharacterized protein LOC143430320 [Xylocopa sonorina]|uniref:uncharacterized protein LOC143430320 n=1 Tax=Xylocopa sonorina TaxID=1818115 RepID=UPI00403A83EB